MGETKIPNPTVQTHNERCDECGGPIDTTMSDYYSDEENASYVHRLCYEDGEKPAPRRIVTEKDEGEDDRAWRSKQYNCGHTVYGPNMEHPMLCPVCADLDLTEVEVIQ